MRDILYLLLTLILAGCITFKTNKNSFSALSGQPKRLAVSGEDSQSPFTLSVLDELHDGEKLHVHALLSSKTDWPADAVEVRLIGLGDGQQVVEQIVKMSEVITNEQLSEGLKAKQTYDLLLSIPSSDIAGYQLELFWDQGNAGTGSGRAFALELRSLQVEQRLRCQESPCQIAYSLKGEFFNNSTNVLNDARIAVGFVFVPKGARLDLSTTMPENEEVVVLAGLNLSGGQSKPFRLNIKTLVTERADGNFVPVVRVLEFS